MKFTEIQKEYLFFVQQLLLAQDTLANLIKNGNDFLSNYCKNNNYDINFARKLDAQLFCMENFRLEIDEIAEYIENCSLKDLKLAEKEETDNTISIILKNSNDNLYVDLNSGVIWDKLKNDNK